MRIIANWVSWALSWVGSCVSWLFERRRRTEAIVLIMSVITVILVAIQSVQNQNTAAQEHRAALHSQQITECQTRYNEALARITKIRSRLNDEDREAVKMLNVDTAQFIFGVAAPTPGLTQQQKVARFESLVSDYRRAASSYAHTESRIDAERTAHPVPSLPAGACK